MRNKTRMVLQLVLIIVFAINSSVYAASANSQPQTRESISQALLYLHSVQNNDGGFPSHKGGASSNAVTSWVLMALSASGEDIKAAKWAPAGKSPLDYMNSCKQPLVSSCDYARTILSQTAVQQKIKYQNENLLLKIASFRQNNGQYAQLAKGEKGFINAHIWSVMALYSADQEIPNKAKAREWLLMRQNKDGGFGWGEGIASDADDTAVAIQVMVLLGEEPKTSKSVKRALAYLKTCQKDDGGFGSGLLTANKSNASTDSWVIQGLLACGENPQSDKWSQKGKTAVNHLMSLQIKNGSFNWMPGIASSPVITTSYAVMALNGKPLPVNINYASNSDQIKH
ncbi:MAG: terpene cyclase/mutase family protein [Syntrophomonadaceae bacterium]|nr:terpene cyclase/mutase family protein [Syntrophomonadaceae bacterium]